MAKLKKFYKKCVRVWKVLKKPSKKEFQNISKISAIGVAILGLMGFLMSLLMKSFI